MRFLKSILRVAIRGGLGAAILAGNAAAVTFLDTSYGTPTGAAFTRSAGMGATGVSLYHGSQSVVQNPALLALEPKQVHFDFLLGVTQAAEDRLVPLFDSFDSFVNETTIAVNRNTYAQVQGGVLWRIPVERPMTLAAGVFERYDFDFDYFEEFRDPDFQSSPRDRIIENRTFAVEGILRSLTAGYGAEVLPRVNLGFSMHRYFGEVTTSRSVAVVADGSNTLDDLKRELSGWGWSVGAHGQPLERVEVGVSFEGPFSVDGTHAASTVETGPSPSDTSMASEATIDYPASLSFGLTYHPRNELRTTFSVDFVHRFWEDLEDGYLEAAGDTVRLRDTWDFRVGLEHVFYNGLPLRFGFRYLENYADEESERTIYSVGIGHQIQDYKFDVTGLYHRQTTRQDFIFDPTFVSPSGTTFPSPNSDAKVEDSVLQIVLGVSRSF